MAARGAEVAITLRHESIPEFENITDDDFITIYSKACDWVCVLSKLHIDSETEIEKPS